MIKYILIYVLILGWVFDITAQDQHKESWVDSVMQGMSLEEKIGQTLMIRAHSNLGYDHINKVRSQIKEYHVGGLCFFQGGPERQAELTRLYQSLSKTPLLISMDAEWGLGMRFKQEGFSFPRQLTLGATRSSDLTREMACQIGKQLKTIGVHLNFAPVVDINNNPYNPVINDRSFGEDPQWVIENALAYLEGLNDSGVGACAKHFPGHGDTDVDSHYELPVLNHSLERLDSLELQPFRKMISAGVSSIMVAHLNIPALDDRAHIPTTLSEKAVKGLLREQLGFEGVIITDAMEMKAVTKHFPQGEAEALALMAGNDIICLPSDVPHAFNAIREALRSGTYPLEELEKSVKRILSMKYDLGLSKDPGPAISENIKEELDTTSLYVLREAIYDQGITCLKNSKNLIPVKAVGEGLMGSLSLGTRYLSPFQSQLAFYTRVIDFQTDKYFEQISASMLLEQLEMMDIVFVALHDLNKKAEDNFGITEEQINFLNELRQRTQIVLVLFGSPYAATLFEDFDELVVAYDDTEDAQKITAQMLFGARHIKGSLPVTAGGFEPGSSFTIPDLQRLSMGIPESVGLNSDTLALIDSIALELIREEAAPGCQVLVAKDGKIVYHKAFGHHTYEKTSPVLTTDVYDVASLTKVAATTLAVMKLHDEGKIDLDDRLGKYLPDTRGTNKERLVIRDILSHRAGLQPWIPFYKSTLAIDQKGDKVPDSKYYLPSAKGNYVIPVAHSLFLNKNYPDSIYKAILDSKLKRKGRYVYSDLGMMLMAKLIEDVDGRTLDHFVMQEFYRPMGLRRTRFNPLQTISPASIPPTEEDDYFRMQRVHGYVHDMGSAMLGGVSGHAGLFSNSQELAALFQMLLNGGVYGGERYLSASTVSLFTQRVKRASRRGIGFDMKELNDRNNLNMAEEASALTFGHLGFTGVSAWADPKHNIIVIFLSNRTYPKMNNWILSKKNYRPKIQSIPYRALILDSTSS